MHASRSIGGGARRDGTGVVAFAKALRGAKARRGLRLLARQHLLAGAARLQAHCVTQSAPAGIGAMSHHETVVALDVQACVCARLMATIV